MAASMNKATALLNDSERILKKSQLPDLTPAPGVGGSSPPRRRNAAPHLSSVSGGGGTSMEERDLFNIAPMKVSELFTCSTNHLTMARLHHCRV